MSITIKNVSDDAFRTYGRILTKAYNIADLLKKMEETPIPEDVIYVPSDEKLEELPIFQAIQNSVYGGMPIQIGYCNGHNHLLNAVEYHRSSEINIAATDLILLLGREQDIQSDFTYRTENIEAFLVPQGTMIEVYATTLHYAPCGISGKGFQSVVVLPKGTNLGLTTKPVGSKEDSLLTAVNKWLIAHMEANIDEAFVGLIGENISVL